MKRKLRVDKNFTPCPAEENDELFRNGIFEFNITRILKYIEESQDGIILEEVNIGDFFNEFSKLTEAHVETVDISKQLILAEISPGQYNIIDGNHRIEKMRRMGIAKALAWKLTMEQHINFLVDKKAYFAYVGYWNGKLSGR